MKNLALLLAMPALIACASPPGTQLSGTRWIIAQIDGSPAVSDRARLEFHSDRISATVGCNGLGGEWQVRGNRIVSGPWISTQMYCDGVMEQEQAVASLFGANPNFELSGNRLTLIGGGHTLVLTRDQ